MTERSILCGAMHGVLMLSGAGLDMVAGGGAFLCVTHPSLNWDLIWWMVSSCPFMFGAMALGGALEIALHRTALSAMRALLGFGGGAMAMVWTAQLLPEAPLAHLVAMFVAMIAASMMTNAFVRLVRFEILGLFRPQMRFG
ncbi:MAG: hypothetical protein VX874_24635 [Pseudomonadota bacterium]|nr:hypothetical protein [Pseudomonadota bacterium]